jgi:hypothetical protein
MAALYSTISTVGERRQRTSRHANATATADPIAAGAAQPRSVNQAAAVAGAAARKCLRSAVRSDTFAGASAG